jgi:peptide/nickel transport system substrate-binding protein
VNASGTKGAPVKVNVTNDPVGKGLGEAMVGVLNRLGYKATLQALSPAIQYPYVQNSKNKVEVGESSWYQDYPAASDFLNILLGCASFHPNSNSSPNIAEYCNPSIQAMMDHAATVGIRNLTAANDIWAEVDKKVTDDAPWVDMFNPKYLDFVSSRLKNHVFSPQWYFLLDEAKLK